MPGCGHGFVGGERVVVCLVEVVEGRHRKQRFGREGVDPVGNGERVALGLAIAQVVGAVVVGGALVVVGVGVVGNLKEVLAILSVEAQLVPGRLIVNQGDEAASGVGGIVKDGGDRRGEAVI